MSKTKEKNNNEYFKSIIRKQKSIIKQLKKEAGRGNKTKERYEELEDSLTEKEFDTYEPYIAEDTTKCPECLKGTLEIIDLKVRKMTICNSCNYRFIRK